MKTKPAASPLPIPEPTPDARARLVAAARRLFAEKGYAAAAVHEITDAAGVNRALLYYYFEDKHDLYQAVVDEGGREFIGMVETTLAGPGSHAERLAAFARGHLELCCRNADMFRVVHRCLLDGQQEEFRLLETFHAATGRLEAFLQEGMEAGAFRPMNPAIAARALMGPTYVFSLCRISEGELFAQDEIAEVITAQLLHGYAAPA
jgi:AcrR family transcriptional regulator